ncbi:MAG: sigma 54-interacting transcriptional regulator [Desulfobacterales bacterium]|nr:MAG: sigma 54-interacting transcriptional regulator [Desulfobacterales bacterium]
MKDAAKTKKQLIEELSALRRRVTRLEGSAAPPLDEEHYRSMVEASPVAIMAIRNGCFLFVNPAGARMLAFSGPEELVGTPALDVVAPESQPTVAERIRRLEQGKDNPLAEIALIRRDGTRIIAESRSVSISIHGIPTAVIIAQDISERKQKEEKLKMMQFSIDHAFDRIAWIAPDGRLLYANKATCDEMGYTLEEVLAMSIPDVDPNFPAERWAEHVQAVKHNGSILFETQNISGDGKIHDIEVSTNYVKFDDHEFLCAFGRDITQRKRAELKLKQNEERFRAFMDHNPAAIYVKDEAGRHIYGNRTVLELTGMELDEFIGTTSHDFFPPDIAGQLEAADQKVRDTKTRLEVDEYVETIGGRASWRAEIKFPIQIDSGKTYVGGIAIDITERKRAEEELQQAFSEIKRLNAQLEAENVYLRDEVELHHKHEEIIGKSEAIRKMLSRAEQVAETDSTVLILGETGTGKELLARAIHKHSARKERQMVKVNCAALPPTLIESELFGREKGAYTGAMNRQIGRFEIADGSTIFLDEIGELPLELQAKLLRVLEEGQFERLGSPKTISVNVRIITSTNRDLARAVAEGRFREDLYYRLNVFSITVPPLRDRSEDIPLLVWAFVKEFEKSMGKTIENIPQKTMAALQGNPWPGNVRELRNIIEQAMIVSQGTTLMIQLPGGSEHSGNILLKDVERNHILRILRQTGWRIRGTNGAAELLGLKPTTLEARMKKLKIKRPQKDLISV